jgi:hypothetical protein
LLTPFSGYPVADFLLSGENGYAGKINDTARAATDSAADAAAVLPQ